MGVRFPAGCRVDIFERASGSTRQIATPCYSRRPPTIETESWLLTPDSEKKRLRLEWKRTDPEGFQQQEVRRAEFNSRKVERANAVAKVAAGVKTRKVRADKGKKRVAVVNAAPELLNDPNGGAQTSDLPVPGGMPSLLEPPDMPVQQDQGGADDTSLSSA